MEMARREKLSASARRACQSVARSTLETNFPHVEKFYKELEGKENAIFLSFVNKNDDPAGRHHEG
jgi:hypothetical protein